MATEAAAAAAAVIAAEWQIHRQSFSPFSHYIHQFSELYNHFFSLQMIHFEFEKSNKWKNCIKISQNHTLTQIHLSFPIFFFNSFDNLNSRKYDDDRACMIILFTFLFSFQCQINCIETLAFQLTEKNFNRFKLNFSTFLFLNSNF